MIDKILSGIGNSKASQKFYKWATNPKNEKILNQRLPQAETVIATSLYMISTARQKNIDKDRKDMLQIQNVASGVAGLCVASALSKKVGNFGEKVIKGLDPEKIPPENIKQIGAGLRVGIPLVTTAFCMRFLIPSAIALFSEKVMDKVRDKREEHRKLDLKG